MRTLVLEPPPAQLRELLDRRRRTGADRHDEVWQGVLHMVPAAAFAHSLIVTQLVVLLGASARAAGLTVSVEFNLGVDGDFRVPDLGVHRGLPCGTWISTAAVVVEVLSPHDESWEKLPFYAAREVAELIVVDPATRSVDWRVLQDGTYRAAERSGLMALDAGALAQQIDWPPVDP